MKPAPPKTERPPATRFRPAVFRGARSNAITLALIGCVMILGRVVPLRAQEENLAKNGAFEEGIETWIPLASQQAEKPPVSLAWETKDPAGKSKGALRVVIRDLGLPEGQFWSINTGAVCPLTKYVLKGTELKVSFDAKAITGSFFLRVTRAWGGASSEAVEISENWKKYEVIVSTDHETPALLFTLVPGATPNPQNVQSCMEGEFLLDNVEITEKKK